MNCQNVIGIILFFFGIGCFVIASVTKKMKFKDPTNEVPTIRALKGLGIFLLIVGALLLAS